MDKLLPENTEILIRYADGELEAAEQVRLENELKENAVLRAELDNILLAKNAIQLFGTKEKVAAIRQQMKNELNAKTSVSTPKGKISSMVRYSMAIAASILILIIGIKSFQYFTISATGVYNDQYTHYELGSFRSGNDISPGLIEQAYRKQDYTGTVKLAKQSDTLTVKEQLLEGISLLELDKADEGITVLSKVVKSGGGTESAFPDVAEYYLALAYLKTKHYDQCLKYLDSIHANPQHLYYEKISDEFIVKVRRLGK